MIAVSHRKPHAEKLSMRFEEGSSESEKPRWTVLLSSLFAMLTIAILGCNDLRAAETETGWIQSDACLRDRHLHTSDLEVLKDHCLLYSLTESGCIELLSFPDEIKFKRLDVLTAKDATGAPVAPYRFLLFRDSSEGAEVFEEWFCPEGLRRESRAGAAWNLLTDPLPIGFELRTVLDEIRISNFDRFPMARVDRSDDGLLNVHVLLNRLPSHDIAYGRANVNIGFRRFVDAESGMLNIPEWRDDDGEYVKQMDYVRTTKDGRGVRLIWSIAIYAKGENPADTEHYRASYRIWEETAGALTRGNVDCEGWFDFVSKCGISQDANMSAGSVISLEMVRKECRYQVSESSEGRMISFDHFKVTYKNPQFQCRGKRLMESGTAVWDDFKISYRGCEILLLDAAGVMGYSLFRCCDARLL